MFLQVCPVCEHRNPRGSRFCNECGSPLQLRFCPHCHAAEDVMALECRTCGERLPLLVLTDESAVAETLPPAGGTWQPQAPDPAPFEPTIDGERVRLDALPAPEFDDPFTTITAPPGAFAPTAQESPFREGATPTSAAPADKPAVAPLAQAASVPVDRDGSAKARKARKTSKQAIAPSHAPAPADATVALVPAIPRGPSIIEKLSSTQQRFDFLASAPPLPPGTVGGARIAPATTEAAPVVEPVDSTPSAPLDAPVAASEAAVAVSQPVVAAGESLVAANEPTEAANELAAPTLQAESESEIEVAAEAETLVEASVAPITYAAAVDDTTPDVGVDDIARQLRHDAWRHAMPEDAAALTPALIAAPRAPVRRLALGRVALAGGVVATLATLTLLRFAPGTTGAPVQAAATPAVTAQQADPPAQTAATKPAAAPAPVAVTATTAATTALPVTTNAAMSNAPTVTAAAPDASAAQATVPNALADNATPATTSATPASTPNATAMSTPPAATDDGAANPVPPAPAGRDDATATPPMPSAQADATTVATPRAAEPRRAPAVRTAEAPAPRTRAAAVEAPRVCTPAIAALGLCTLPPADQGN